MKILFLAWFGTTFHMWCHLEVEVNILTFSKWLFWSRGTLLYQKWHRKLNIPATWPWRFPIFWVFDPYYSWNINGDMTVQSFGSYWDLMTSLVTDFYKWSRNPMIHMYSKFNGDIFVRVLVIMKNVISLIKEHIGPICSPPCDVIDDIITMKILFLASFHIWSQIDASNILTFSKMAATRDKLFFYRKWYRKLNMPAR